MTRTDRLAVALAIAVIVAIALLARVEPTNSRQTPAWTVPPSAITMTWSSPELAPAPTAIRLPRWSGAEADQSPAATHEAPAVSTALPAARPAASHSLAELVATGTASFYDAGSGLCAALPGPWRAGRWVRVCGMAQCVQAAVVTSCVCGTHVIDLSPQLWERVSGLDTAHRWQFGVTTVSLVIEGEKP